MTDRVSPNWLLGNTTASDQWENSNSGVAFPFDDDSVPESFPNWILVDAFFVVPSNVVGDVSLSCLHIGPSLVSVTFNVGGRPALEGHSTVGSFSPYTPVRLSTFIPGVGGMVTFGEVDFSNRVMMRDSIRISESAVFRPDVGRLVAFDQPERMETASGDVGFDIPSDVFVKIANEGNTSEVDFSVSKSLADTVRAPCNAESISAGTLVNVTNINGVSPNEKGQLAIVFRRKAQ